jgi:tRNA A-37 threonylcarbamoyl transferase component Bud32
VWLAELSGQPVVFKQLVEGAEAEERYTREVTALHLAAAADPPVVPRLLDTDPAHRLLVLERLEHQSPRPDWLVGYAAALARLHATGAPAADLPPWHGPSGPDIDAFLAFAAGLGVTIPAGVRPELAGLIDRLAGLGGQALLHGDPCPGNDLHTADGVRFIDFEQATLGSGIVELAYLRIGFPTCWCATAPAPELLAEAEAAYRTAWRTATGTEVSGDLTDACAGWLLRGDALVQRAQRDGTDHLAVARRRDWKWGTASARQRILHRLGVLENLTGADSAMAEFGQFAGTVRTTMRIAWPKLRPLPANRPPE